MKKDLINLIKEVFKDELFFKSLGFTALETEMLYLLFKGNTIALIANELNLPYRVVSKMKSKCLHLVPIYLNRKLEVVNNADFNLINAQLSEVHQNIGLYLEHLQHHKVYDIMELNLPKRITNSLVASNIKNTRDLIQLDKNGLLKIKNLGEQAVAEIEMALRQLDLGFSN